MVYTTGEDFVSGGVALIIYTTGGGFEFRAVTLILHTIGGDFEFHGVHHWRGFRVQWCRLPRLAKNTLHGILGIHHGN